MKRSAAHRACRLAGSPLAVARTAGLVVPREILLAHHAQLAEGLAIAGGIAPGIRGAGEVHASEIDNAYRNSASCGCSVRDTVPRPNGANGTMKLLNSPTQSISRSPPVLPMSTSRPAPP